MWKCFFLIFFLVSICVNNSYSQYLTKKEKKGKWGLVDGKKKVVDFIYDEINTKYLFRSYRVLLDGKWGILDSHGHLIVPCKYDSVEYGDDKGFVVSNDNKYGYYNTETKAPPQFIYEGIESLNAEGDGVVKLDGKWVNLELGEISLDQEKVVFSTPEKMGMFPGCEEQGLPYQETKKCAEKKMLEFIYRNIKFPKEAENNGIQGMVVVSFLVSPEGQLIDLEVLRDIGGGCGRASKEVVEAMPDWIPGEQDGQKVWSRFNLPIRFKL